MSGTDITAYEGLELSPQHAVKVGSSAISREVAEARGYRTIHVKRDLASLGFSRSQQIVPTLLVPVWGVAGEAALYQHRPDVPRQRKDTGKIVKYETPDGSRMAVDVPPGARSRIGDPKVPLWITEGVLKADAAVSAGLCCIALLGVWNWRGTNADSGKTALADWESIALNDRQVYIAFDSDVMTKRAVHDALKRLGGFLQRRGALVNYVYLPQGESGAKVGLDDYLASGGTASVLEKLARAEAAEPEELNRVWPSPQDPMAVARRYMRSFSRDSVPLLRRWRNSWMQWETTHWTEADDATVRSELYGALEHAVWDGLDKDGYPVEMPWQPNKHKIANVNEALAAVTHLPDKINPPAWLARAGTRSAHPDTTCIVACSNGLLDVTTRKLLPHDPSFFNVVSVPFDYEPGATAPLWEEFLRELWEDDPDSVSALQEWFGYVLSGRTDIHKIMLIVGPTRSGKGTIARIVKLLVGGDANVVGPTLASLGGQFGLEPLIGKPLAIIGDARATANSTVAVERLLMVSAHDTLSVDRKNRLSWNGELPTRLMMLSNELPGFGDASGAIVNRFLVLTLQNSWLGREDKDLSKKLAAELPGILNWSLDGLVRLDENLRFAEPKSSDDAVITMLDQASPISAFVRDCCDTGPGHEVPVDDIFEAWKMWCDDSGRRPGTKQTFGKMLNAARPSLRRVQPREDDSRYRAYQGIRLNDTWAKLLGRRSGGSWGGVSADRVPPRSEPPATTPPPPPEHPPARGGTREDLTRPQLPPGSTPAEQTFGDDAAPGFFSADEGEWTG